MRLIIKKLFGKYDYDLNFDNKINILIGENGCGKSTILKIIKYLTNSDYTSLSKIKFDSIQINNSDITAVIYREWLIANSVIKQLDYRKRLYNVIRNFDFSKEFDQFYEEINKLNENAICVDYDDSESFETKFVKDLELLGIKDETCIKFLQEEYFIWNVPYGSMLYFLFIYELCKNDFKNSKYMSYGMFSIKRFTNFENLEKLLPKSKIEIFDFTYFKDKKLKKHYDTRNQFKHILDILHNNNNEKLKDYDSFSNYINLEESNKVFKILDIIFTEEQNKNILDMVFPILSVEYEREYSFIKKLYEGLDCYLNNSEPWFGDYGYFDFKNYNIKLVFDYIISNYDKIINEIFSNEKLLKFKEVLTQYLIGKEVNFDDELNYLISDKLTKKNINFESLSSGEKKIINLFDVIIFANKSILLLDEPELSLSVYWQEMFLNDLLNYSNADKIIIATQSPNLLTEDTIQYLVEVKK